MGEGRARWGRSGEPTALARWVGGHRNPTGTRWRVVAGEALYAQSRCVGVKDGVLRVIASNVAVRDELLDRSNHVVAAWNLAGQSAKSPPAKAFACWVGQGRHALRRVAGNASAPAVPPADMEAAAHEMAGVKDERVREALIAARARAMARGGGGDE